MSEQEKTERDLKVNRREFVGGLMATSAIAGFGASPSFAASFSQNELAYLTATELLPLYKSRKLSPVEVLEAQIAQYEAVNDKVNCVTYTHFDAAMDAAKESEQRWMNGTARSLEGITVGVKDEHHDEGWIVTQGSAVLKDNKMDHADTIVRHLKDAGAVLSIQTTVPEFYLNGVTWSRLWGVSRCPWNLKYAVGGSSGGSGGALAAGLCTIATGSDMGGSVRIPAAFNGVYGFKPPTGRVASNSPLLYISGTGPLARSFKDMAMLQNNMAGQAYEPATLPPLEMPLEYPDISGMRIAYTPGMGLLPLHADTRAAMKVGIERLQSLGATVEEVEIDPGFVADEIADIFKNFGLSGPLGPELGGMADQVDIMTPYAASVVKAAGSGKYGPAKQAAYEGIVKEFYRRVYDGVFNNGFDALISPTLATPHVPADYDLSVGGLVIEGQEIHPFALLAFTIPWNMLNWCPVVNVPVSLSSEGMPIGMQIIGQSYDDLGVFRVAHAYEKVAPKLFSGDLMPDYRNPA